MTFIEGMYEKKLSPNQIITLADFPVHSEQCLKMYFRLFQKGCGKVVPPVPVIHKSTGVPFARGSGQKVVAYNVLLSNFLEQYPKAEYFLLDGSHRTTAAALCHQKIPVMVFARDEDIAEAKRRVKSGELFGLTIGGDSIAEAITALEEHFFKERIFQTVAEKTQRMVQEKVIPQYMIRYFLEFSRL